jgi:peroxiredoxin
MSRYARYIFSATLLALTVICAVYVARGARGVPYDGAFSATAVDSNAYFVDRQAPDFTLTDGSGLQHNLSELRGNVVFLNFWASWCEPCRQEFPAMVGLAETFDGRPFRMVAVSVDETVDDMQNWLEANNIDTSRMLLLHDPNQTVVKAWGTELLPETFLVDPDGRLVLRFQSIRDWNNPEIRSMIERMIIGRWKQG